MTNKEGLQGLEGSVDSEPPKGMTKPHGMTVLAGMTKLAGNDDAPGNDNLYGRAGRTKQEKAVT